MKDQKMCKANPYRVIAITTALLSLLIAPQVARAQKPLDKYVLGWTLPTDDVDGNPIVGDVYVKLYMCDSAILDAKTCAGDLQIVDLPEPNATMSGIAYRPSKPLGMVFIRAAAHYQDTRESALSNEISVPFDVRSAPTPIVNLRLQ